MNSRIASVGDRKPKIISRPEERLRSAFWRVAWATARLSCVTGALAMTYLLPSTPKVMPISRCLRIR